jgi:hypothetical protein
VKENNISIAAEIRAALKSIEERQELILAEIHELRLDQKKLHEEVRISNFVLNNISLRNEIIN